MKEKNKGITLIALIITIVVMLILVGVSVSILINSNLIGAAEKTATAYNQATQKETTLEGITVNNKTLTEYVNATKRKLNFKINGNTYEAYEGETLADWCSRQTFSEDESDPLYIVGLIYKNTNPEVDIDGNVVWSTRYRANSKSYILGTNFGGGRIMATDFYSTISEGISLKTAISQSN